MENEEVKLLTLKCIIFCVALMKDKYNLNVNLVFNSQFVLSFSTFPIV